MKWRSKLGVLALSVALNMLAMPISVVANTGDSNASTRASDPLSAASGMVLSGSVSVVAASGELIVVGVEQSARGVSVIVKMRSMPAAPK